MMIELDRVALLITSVPPPKPPFFSRGYPAPLNSKYPLEKLLVVGMLMAMEESGAS